MLSRTGLRHLTFFNIKNHHGNFLWFYDLLNEDQGLNKSREENEGFITGTNIKSWQSHANVKLTIEKGQVLAFLFF